MGTDGSDGEAERDWRIGCRSHINHDGIDAIYGRHGHGGVLECGETLREATIREAREETGLMVEPGEMLGVYERVIRSEDGRVQYHYVLIDYLCRPVGGELKAGSDAAEVGWFAKEELPALKLAYDANDVVLKGLAKG